MIIHSKNHTKNETLHPDNIVHTSDGFYRYVNHTCRLLTTGFSDRDKLLEYTQNIRFDSHTLKIMGKRYDSEYGKE